VYYIAAVFIAVSFKVYYIFI